jgi:phospholipid transport system substrate-binding protein
MRSSLFIKVLALAPVLLLIIFAYSSFSADSSSSPIDKVKKATEEITKLLDEYIKDPQSRKEETLNKLMEIADQNFDWEEMAKRALSRFWKERTSEEQKEFVILFRDFIKNAYIGKIDSYSGEKVIFEGETIEDNYAEVKTKIITPAKGTEVPVIYRLKNKEDSTWMIYDVVIEGVSLVNNYRDQFTTILQGSSYSELIKRMKDKLAQDSKK